MESRIPQEAKLLPSNALANVRLGISVSDSPDLARLGLLETHFRLALGEIARCVLVSGGFGFFTSRVAEAAGFQRNYANYLAEQQGLLTGQVGEPILGRAAKLEALELEAADLGLEIDQTLAIGDGANDLAMIQAAGLGVAYRAKPIVAAQADARIDHADLTALLYFQGYTAEEFAR